MTDEVLITKIIVPVAAPFVAALAIIIAIVVERKKFTKERRYEQLQKAESVFSEALFATGLYDLIVERRRGGLPINLYNDEFQKGFVRVFHKIFAEPQIGRLYYECVRFRAGRNEFFKLLAEAKIRIASGPSTV